MSIGLLLNVFDKERDRYLEWHDGPQLEEVDSAMAHFDPEERAEASRIVAERIGKGYNPYLGRAAELLGTVECRRALDDALASSRDPYTAGNIARNILALGGSGEAAAALKSIIGNRSLHWGARIDALVNLKIALGASAGKPHVTWIIPQEFKSVILDAVADADYLVRYHAAEALLRAAGDTAPLHDHGELFRLICGKRAAEGEPDAGDREGFRRAVEILKARLKRGQ